MDASPDGSPRRSSGRCMGPDPSAHLSGSQSVYKCESTPESESDSGSASTDFLALERVARSATKRFHPFDWRPLEACCHTLIYCTCLADAAAIPLASFIVFFVFAATSTSTSTAAPTCEHIISIC